MSAFRDATWRLAWLLGMAALMTAGGWLVSSPACDYLHDKEDARRAEDAFSEP